MAQPVLKIQLPDNFTIKHERVVIDYLADRLKGEQAWRLAVQAFDLLDKAVLRVDLSNYTFRAVYEQIVEPQLADRYLHELLRLHDVKWQSPELWSRFARQIVSEFVRLGWRRQEVPETRLLLSYLLYWWGAFARGYAFEIEIFRDLQQSGIQFQAHNLLDRQERFSPSDLSVRGLAGDIKTSVYFIHIAASLSHDFYIVRLFVQGRSYTIVTFLKPAAWDEINGDTLEGKLAKLVQQLARPVRIKTGKYEFVALDYMEWKRRILRLQGEAK